MNAVFTSCITLYFPKSKQSRTYNTSCELLDLAKGQTLWVQKESEGYSIQHEADVWDVFNHPANNATHCIEFNGNGEFKTRRIKLPPTKKLFKLSQSMLRDCDTYDSCVVIATSEEEARGIFPDGKTLKTLQVEYDEQKNRIGFIMWDSFDDFLNSESDAWPILNPEVIEVEFLADYVGELPVGTVVCASFNAG